jgi:hypothetical protein
MAKTMESVIPIMKEWDYTKFSFSHSNRVVIDNHVKALVKSLKQKDIGESCPILVDDKLEIVDGQHRFHARKQLGLPIYYTIIRDYDQLDLILLNQYNKRWSMDDYVHTYASRGLKDYINIEADLKSFNIPNFNTMTCLLYGRRLIKSETNALKSGKFTYTPDLRNQFRTSVAELQAFSGFPKYKDYRFITAYARIRKLEGYDFKMMQRQIASYLSTITPQTSQEGYFDAMIRLYNYNRPAKYRLKAA